MGSYSDVPAGVIIHEAKDYKARSLLDKDGVQYMDHLWGLIMNETAPLQVVLRTDDDVFTDIPVRVWWTHGWYNFDRDRESRSERSELLFDVPDEVWRRLQSSYAANVMRELFGVDKTIELPAGLRNSTDDSRIPYVKYRGDEFTTEEIRDDWRKLRQAIELSAKDSGGHLSGQSVQLYGGNVGKARVVKSRLEIHVGKTVDAAIRDWQIAARHMIAAGDNAGIRRLY